MEFEDLKKDHEEKSKSILRLEETSRKIQEDMQQIRREVNDKLSEHKDKDELIEKREEEYKNLKERITESETNFDELEKQYTEVKQEFKVRFNQTKIIILPTSFSFIIKKILPSLMISIHSF